MGIVAEFDNSADVWPSVRTAPSVTVKHINRSMVKTRTTSRDELAALPYHRARTE